MEDSPGASKKRGGGGGKVFRDGGLDVDESVIPTGDNRQSMFRVLTVKSSALLFK